MPWPTKGKDNDYYCDAQCFPGLGCCAEFDMNEGNMDVQQMTNHACTRDYGSHPDWQCNKWGDPEVKTHASDFAPGPGHTIDSGKPFTYSQKFEANGDDFTFTTTISQEDRQVVLRMGPGSSQLNAMLQELRKGMAFVTGYWFARDMNWMDGEVCGNGPEHCNMHPAYITNWRITSNAASSPPATRGQAAGFASRHSLVLNSKPFLFKGKSLSHAAGAVLINEDGVSNTYYLPGATTLDGGNTVKYLPPYRYYLMKIPTTNYSNKDDFFMPIFPGKTFSVDIDFKRDGPGCGCNLNFYLVGMPWPTKGKDNDYYCDAQCFPGLGCCAEFDMNEGNMDVQQITNHACTRDYGSHPDWQ